MDKEDAVLLWGLLVVCSLALAIIIYLRDFIRSGDYEQ